MGDMKILIIEDDVEMCNELRNLLEDERYNVDTVHDGPTGIRLVAEDGYNAVLLDLKLPEMSGYDVLKRLKDERPDVKVLVLTGSPVAGRVLRDDEISLRSAEKKDILEMADGVITKPFDVESMISKIRTLVGKN